MIPKIIHQTAKNKKALMGRANAKKTCYEIDARL